MSHDASEPPKPPRQRKDRKPPKLGPNGERIETRGSKPGERRGNAVKGSHGPRRSRTQQALITMHKLTKRTPLEIMLIASQGGPEGEKITDKMLDAAKAAAPYVHHRLATVQIEAPKPPSVELDLTGFSTAEIQALEQLLLKAQKPAKTATPITPRPPVVVDVDP